MFHTDFVHMFTMCHRTKCQCLTLTVQSLPPSNLKLNIHFQLPYYATFYEKTVDFFENPLKHEISWPYASILVVTLLSLPPQMFTRPLCWYR